METTWQPGTEFVTLTACRDGQYLSVVEPGRAGLLSISVMLDGWHVLGSPAFLLRHPARVDAVKTSVSGPITQNFTVGQETCLPDAKQSDAGYWPGASQEKDKKSQKQASC